MTRRPKALVALLRRYDPPVRGLALHLRELVLREIGPCHEHIYDAGYTVAVWYSFTSRITDSICLIAVYTKHVNLGFNRGSVLGDPHQLLEGTGAWMRHIKMRSRADIDRPEIRGYIQSAIAEASDDPVPGEERPELRRVITTVNRRRTVKSARKAAGRGHRT